MLHYYKEHWWLRFLSTSSLFASLLLIRGERGASRTWGGPLHHLWLPLLLSSLVKLKVGRRAERALLLCVLLGFFRWVHRRDRPVDASAPMRYFARYKLISLLSLFLSCVMRSPPFEYWLVNGSSPIRYHCHIPWSPESGWFYNWTRGLFCEIGSFTLNNRWICDVVKSFILFAWQGF